MSMGSLDLSMSAARLAAGIRARRWSAREVTEKALDRIGAVNRALNAIVTLRAEAALAEADAADRALEQGAPCGPLHGVPITIKDSFDTAGTLSTWGTVGRRNTVPREDATAVARLRAAGAIVLGKTNTSELTLSFETDNRLFGRTSNPYDLERSAGGSSGGAAAIVAAGGAALDVGSDTGGSVRLPSHFCGIAGLRPTSGRVSRAGNALGPGGLLDALTQVGPMARYVEDLELALGLIAGPDGRDPYVVPVPLASSARVEVASLRVAVFTDNGIAAPAGEVEAAVHAAADALRRAGARVEEVRPRGIEETLDLWRRVMTVDGRAWAWHQLARAGTAPEDATISLRPVAPSIEPTSLVNTVQRLDDFRAGMLELLCAHEVILCPPAACCALPHGTLATNVAAFTYSIAWNLVGWPAVVVRAGTTTAGLPVGVQVVAGPFREDIALAAAAFIERALGGFAPPPL